MFQLFTDLTKKSPAIDQKINEIQNQLKCLPEGKLTIAHNGKTPNGISLTVKTENIFQNPIVPWRSN